LPAMLARLAALPDEIAAVDRDRRALAAAHTHDVPTVLAAAYDRLTALDALQHAVGTGRVAAVEGWVPEAQEERVTTHLEERVGPALAIGGVADEGWVGQPVPVRLSNPPLFRPFETVIGMMPLPSYGTIDPTPFVAVSFPV